MDPTFRSTTTRSSNTTMAPMYVLAFGKGRAIYLLTSPWSWATTLLLLTIWASHDACASFDLSQNSSGGAAWLEGEGTMGNFTQVSCNCGVAWTKPLCCRDLV